MHISLNNLLKTFDCIFIMFSILLSSISLQNILKSIISVWRVFLYLGFCNSNVMEYTVFETLNYAKHSIKNSKVSFILFESYLILNNFLDLNIK